MAREEQIRQLNHAYIIQLLDRYVAADGSFLNTANNSPITMKINTLCHYVALMGLIRENMAIELSSPGIWSK